MKRVIADWNCPGHEEKDEEVEEVYMLLMELGYSPASTFLPPLT